MDRVPNPGASRRLGKVELSSGQVDLSSVSQAELTKPGMMRAADGQVYRVTPAEDMSWLFNDISS